MQTIEPTFERWHLPGHGEILHPVDNIVAGVRYAVARYGSVSLVPGVLSLAAGKAYRGY
jgi:SLT domain-containing protein